MADRRSPSATTLLAGDLAALCLFAVLGLLSHEHGVTLSGLARTAGPLVGSWLAAAAVVGAYRRPGLGTLLATWALAVPVGVLVRALVLGRDVDGGTAAFLGVALGVTLALLLLSRGLATALARRPAAG